MYLLYIDDSGTSELKKNNTYSLVGGNSKYFVLGAILIKAHDLNAAQPLIDNFRRKCLKNELDEIKYSPENKTLNCVKGCKYAKLNKDCYRSEIANMIIQIPCLIFASIQNKYNTTLNKVVQSKHDIYKLSFEHLLKIVDSYMCDIQSKDDVIVFIDHKDNRTNTDDVICQAYKDALKNKNIFKSFGNKIFAPSINVVSSRHTVGVQLADFIAGSIWKFYETKNDKEKHDMAREITQQFAPLIYKNEKGIQKSLTYCKEWFYKN